MLLSFVLVLLVLVLAARLSCSPLVAREPVSCRGVSDTGGDWRKGLRDTSYEDEHEHEHEDEHDKAEMI